MKIFTSDELALWSKGEWTTLPTDKITGFCFDSRKIKKGDIFVALRTDSADGHKYIDAAFKGGAAAAIIDDRKYAANYPCLAVSSTLNAFRAIAREWRKAVAPFVIGVTGSVGKSTVKEWTAAFLSAHGRTAYTCENFNNEIGVPFSLLSTIDEATEYGVFEAGISHPSDMDPLVETIMPSAAIITTIAPVHIEYFDSCRAIALEKGKLLHDLSRDNAFAVLDRRSEFYDLLVSLTQARIVSVALLGEKEDEEAAKDADFIARVINEATGEFKLIKSCGLSPFTASVRRVGAHNIYNVLLAIAAAASAGVGQDTIIKVLTDGLPSMKMRWERQSHDGYEWINDAYNANPLSMAASIKAFASTTEKEGYSNRAFVIGDMFELGDKAVEYHRDTARAFEEIGTNASDLLICVGELARNYATSSFKGRVIFTDNSADAGKIIRQELPQGSIILLKASHGMHMEAALG